MDFKSWLAVRNPEIPYRSAEAVLELSAEGATVPFIARYRKEKTGNLDEVAIRHCLEAKEKWDEIVKRQLHILGEIDKQQKLTPELRDQILATFQMEALEDLYLPYKQKRKTKAVMAREAGLEPLADWIWKVSREEIKTDHTLEEEAKKYLSEEKKVSDVAVAIVGAQDILIERLSEMTDLREEVRQQMKSRGFVRSAKGDKAKTPSQYENYFSFTESVKSLMDPRKSHRYLALRRGWNEGELTVAIGGGPQDETFEARLLDPFSRVIGGDRATPVRELVHSCAQKALKAHVMPSIENEIHKMLKEEADQAAVQVFSENVGNLLMAPPFGAKSVMGVDPGLRTGCKIAIVDDTGAFIAQDLIHIQSEGDKKRSADVVVRLAREHRVQAIAVGNGTAGRETEAFLRQALQGQGLGSVPVVMVSESGASVYSASDVAREEFPQLDVTVRGAISIARRLQDPLAELVKVDPKSIGVGQYQHDVSATLLKKSLNDVVDSCVNRVGVNLNTASARLLARVSGIGSALAKAIVDHRSSEGVFHSRQALLSVPHFSKKSFEQSAGFLRVPGAENPLDNTGVHPERYALLGDLAERLGVQLKDFLGAGVKWVQEDTAFRDKIGEFTHQDILQELEKPGRDPREEFVPFQFREDIHEVKDLKGGMECPGIVTNVTNFGAFVDIGVHQDGLVHISQISDGFVKDPREIVKPGDHVKVRVLEVNLEKKQIALTMRSAQAEKRRPSFASPSGGPRPARTREGSQPRGPRQEGRRPSGPGRGPRPAGPRRPLPLNPNNPFHQLAALRDQLARAPGSDKKKKNPS